MIDFKVEKSARPVKLHALYLKPTPDSKGMVKKGIFVNGRRAEMLAKHYAWNHIPHPISREIAI